MIGAVRLTVADLDQAVAYYERVIGLRMLERDGDVVRLGADTALVELEGDPGAPPRGAHSTGLFHLAVLVPTRADLARAVRRVVETGERFTGASDHLVSEALYLRDPEGNGIELYRDRPRETWQYDGDEIRMGTVALDLGDLMRNEPDGEDAGMPEGARIGHVHLQVADLADAEAFYAGELGLDVTVRSYPGALFLSRGGYHHHVGANTWASAGSPPAPAGSRGLKWFEIDVPGSGALTDPSGNRLLPTPATRAPSRPRGGQG
jgi:catechol 2,3-dioxygenase